MISKKRKWVTMAMVLAALYVATWIGGWRSQQTQINGRAWETWHSADQQYQSMMQIAPEEGWENYRPDPGGPVVHMWCVPVLPGMLLVRYSYEAVDEVSGTKIVIHYGTGSLDAFSAMRSLRHM
jgi:hypothetical protein